MKSSPSNHRLNSFALAPALAAAAVLASASARAQIFVMESETLGTSVAGHVNEYSLSGAPMAAPLLNGIPNPSGLFADSGQLFFGYSSGRILGGAVGEDTLATGAHNSSFIIPSGAGSTVAMAGDGAGDLYVLSGDTIGEYNLSGAAIKPALIRATDTLLAFALDGRGHIFVSGRSPITPLPVSSYFVAEYTTAGALVNSSVIHGLAEAPAAIAVDSHDNLFLADGQNVAEYNSSGALLTHDLLPELPGYAAGLSLDGQGDLYVLSEQSPLRVGQNALGEYTTSGAVINPSLISDLTNPVSFTILTPEPAFLTLALAAAPIFLAASWMKNRRLPLPDSLGKNR